MSKHREEYVDRKGYKEVWFDNIAVALIYQDKQLHADVWSVADMRDDRRLKEVERLLDTCPIAAVKKVDHSQPIRRPAAGFRGALTPFLEEKRNHPLGVSIMSTSGSKKEFGTDFYLQHMKAAVNPGGEDLGYSSMSFTLRRKTISEEEADEFRKLFKNMCGASDAFYGRGTEYSMISQRDIFLARTADNVAKQRTVPDFEIEIWDVYWLNYFGPGYVKFWGNNKMDALAQEYKVEYLGNGGICVETTPGPVCADEAVKGITDYAFKKHFYRVVGQDAFMYENQKKGIRGQYVPMLADHRRALV